MHCAHLQAQKCCRVAGQVYQVEGKKRIAMYEKLN